MTKIKQERAKLRVKALRDYRRGEPLRMIAIRYGVSVGTVSLWAMAAGIARRPQGCRTKDFPDEADINIVNAVRAVRDGRPTLAEIGLRWQMSRANVHRIYHRWKNWEPVVPFKVGDTVRFMGLDYEVVDPGVFEGKVRSLKTGEESKISWKLKVKIGKKTVTYSTVKL
jgi:hypothetical protein